MDEDLQSLGRDDPKLVVLRFNEAINAQDLEALSALMTDDHRFVDSENHETVGLVAEWRVYEDSAATRQSLGIAPGDPLV